MSDSSQAQAYYVEENNWGETPSGAEMQELRMTGEELGQSTDTTVSEEIREDRQNTDVLRTNLTAEGSIDIEVSHEAYNDLIAGAMMADWSNPIGISATDIGVDGPNDQFTSPSGSGTDFTAENISVGQWIKVDGFSNSDNNGYFRVSSIAEDALGVEFSTLTDEASGPTVTIDGKSIANGTTEKSFSLEKFFSDVGEYVAFRGMRVGTFGLTVETESILTGSFGFQGKKAEALGSSIGSSIASAPQKKVMNAIDNISNVREGGSLASAGFSSFSFEMDNALRPQTEIGELGAREIGLGTVEVTGSLSAYFESRDLYEKYLNFTETDFYFLAEGNAGNAYMFSFPRFNFTDGNVVASGRDEDVMTELDFTAMKEKDGMEKTVQIDSFPTA